MRSAISPKTNESPQCLDHSCQGWAGLRKISRATRLDTGLFAKKIFIRNFTMKYSIASKESRNRNGSRKAVGGFGYFHQKRRIMKSRWKEDFWPIQLGVSNNGGFWKNDEGLGDLQPASPVIVSALQSLSSSYSYSLDSMSRLNIVSITPLFASWSGFSIIWKQMSSNTNIISTSLCFTKLVSLIPQN